MSTNRTLTVKMRGGEAREAGTIRPAHEEVAPPGSGERDAGVKDDIAAGRSGVAEGGPAGDGLAGGAEEAVAARAEHVAALKRETAAIAAHAAALEAQAHAVSPGASGASDRLGELLDRLINHQDELEQAVQSRMDALGH